MNMIRLVESFNLFLAVLFTVAYFYQLVYLVIGLVKRRRWKQAEAAQYHRYAAVISARNEAGVIGELIQSLKQQNYPAHLLDIYVVADNCTDDTAQVSRRAGAIVYERFNQSKKGKGYALNFLFRTLAREGRDQYDAYFIFDADNLVDPNFVLEMNKVYDQGGYGAITCYRNSRNFGANWISAGYAIWFLREARFLNFPRMLLGTNCHVSGTGFLISADVIRENKGWPYHLLTEDIEFSVGCALKGRRIGYCDKAVIYQGVLSGGRQVRHAAGQGLLPQAQPEELVLLRHVYDRGPRHAAHPGHHRLQPGGVPRLPGSAHVHHPRHPGRVRQLHAVHSEQLLLRPAPVRPAHRPV